MDKKPDDILDLSLVLQIKIRPRISLFSDTDSHGKSFLESEHIFICFVVADEKDAGLPQVGHESQHGLSLPSLSWRESVHRKLAKSHTGRRRQLRKERQHGHAHTSRLCHTSVMKGE